MPFTDAFNLVIIVALPTISGVFIILSMNGTHRLPWMLLLALGFGLGTGLVSQWLLYLSIFHQRFSVLAVNLPFLVIPLVLSPRVLANKAGHTLPPFTEWAQKDRQRFDAILKSFILVMVYMIFWRGLYMPVFEWDAVSTDVFRAKIFYFSRSMEYIYNTPHNTYPLHLPLLQTWFALNWGAWNDQYVKAFYPLYSISMLVVVYHFLKLYRSRTAGLLGVALILSSNFYVYHSVSAYRDITIMYYNCVALLLLLLWHRTKNRPFLLIAALSGGFATFVKLEGTGYIFIQIMLLAVMLFISPSIPWTDKFKSFARFSIPSVFICLTYHLYKLFHITLRRDVTERMNDFDLYNIQLTTSGLTGKIVTVFQRYVDNMFFSFNWNILWLILFISLFDLKRIREQLETKLLLFVFFIYFGIYFTGYTLTKHFFWVAETSTVLSRSLLHFFPLACVLIVLINSEKRDP